MDKKKLSIIIGSGVAVVAIVLLCLFCCKGSSDTYCNVIPKNASSLMRVDAYSFIKKHDIDLSQFMAMAGTDMDDIPSSIDFEKPIYGFLTQKGATGIVAAVKSAEGLEQIVNQYGIMLNAKCTEAQGYKWIETSDMLACFDDSKLLALQGGGMNARKDMLKMMEQSDDESIVSTPLYKQISEINKPFAVIASAKSFPAASLQAYGLNEASDELNFIISFDIEKDKAMLAFDLTANSDEAQEMLDKYASSLNKIEGKYLNVGQQDPLVWGAMNIKGAQLLESYSKAFNLAEITAETGIDAEKLVKSFCGDLTFCMPDANEEFILQADVKDSGVLGLVDQITKASQGSLKAMKTGDIYTISDGGKPLFVGWKDGTLYASSSNNAEKLMQQSNNALDPLKSEICDSYFYLTLDVQKSISILNQDKSFRRSTMLFAPRLNKMDRLTIRSSSPTHTELTLSVKNGEDFVKTLLK